MMVIQDSSGFQVLLLVKSISCPKLCHLLLLLNLGMSVRKNVSILPDGERGGRIKGNVTCLVKAFAPV